MRVYNGSYVGTGAALAVRGVGFKPDAVIIKSATSAGVAHLITSTMGAGTAKPISGATALTAGLFTSLDADGFTLDTGAALNSNGVTYYYVAFKQAANNCKVFTYTGVTGGLTVTGVGFQPDFLIISSAGASTTMVKFSTGAADSVQSLSGADTTGQITSVNSDGFVVAGANANTNTNGGVYHCLAFKIQPGVFNILANYTGNGTSQSLTGAGFSPTCAFVKGTASTTAIIRFKKETGTNSVPVTAAAELGNGVTSFDADGFTTGANANTNTNAAVFRTAVFRDTPKRRHSLRQVRLQ